VPRDVPGRPLAEFTCPATTPRVPARCLRAPRHPRADSRGVYVPRAIPARAGAVFQGGNGSGKKSAIPPENLITPLVDFPTSL
jgi:hypothetical protein